MMKLHSVEVKTLTPEIFRMFQVNTALLTAGDEKHLNTMTIGWGQLRQSFALAWFNGSNIYFSLRHTGTGQLWFLDGSARAVQERVAKNRAYTYPYFEQVYIDDLYLK